MTAAALRNLGRAAAERVSGIGPGRFRAFAAALSTGTATAALTYKLLRSADDGGQ